MARPPRIREIAESLSEASREVQELSIADHAINVEISKLMWFELRALSDVHGCSVSDIVRNVIHTTLDEFDKAHNNVLSTEAGIRLALKAEQQARIATLSRFDTDPKSV